MSIRPLKSLVLFMLFFSLVPASLLFAQDKQDNSITRAIELVEEFRQKTYKTLNNSIRPKALEQYKRDSFTRWKSTKAELDSLNWTDRPGTRRTKLVSTTVERFITSEIVAILELRKGLSSKERKKVTALVEDYKGHQETILSELDEMSKKVYTKDEIRKPVPIIDSSPYEKGPEAEGGGIWQR